MKNDLHVLEIVVPHRQGRFKGYTCDESRSVQAADPILPGLQHITADQQPDSVSCGSTIFLSDGTIHTYWHERQSMILARSSLA